MQDGQNLLDRHEKLLAPYAQKNQKTLGRVYQESPDHDRLPFQRDRDRIIHCASFRRLQGKRQVVSPSLGDHYRNRLSHTLEVVQISRDIARLLHLNEDLCEAIALAHDLGHPPFGHDGEKILDQKMRAFGKTFEHNEQSLRIVEYLEARYPDFRGLNLSYEVREGLQKHSQHFHRPDGVMVRWPSLEAQLVDLCDEMAYLAGDLEDAIRGNYIQLSQLSKAPICKTLIPNLIPLTRSTLNRNLLHVLIQRLSQESLLRLQSIKLENSLVAQNYPERLIGFNPESEKEFLELKAYLYQNFYLIPEVLQSSQAGQKIIADLFDYFYTHPESIPQDLCPEEPLESRICDYIAGMTDAYAEKTHSEKILL